MTLLNLRTPLPGDPASSIYQVFVQWTYPERPAYDIYENGIELTLVAIPEPSTYGLIGAGVLGGLVVLRRKRLRQVNSSSD